MEMLTLTVSGDGLTALPDTIAENLGGHLVQVQDTVWIVFSEKWYLRTFSQLMSAVICAFVGEDTCSIHVVTGGGGYGVFNSSFGAEKSRNHDLLSLMKAICHENTWDIGTHNPRIEADAATPSEGDASDEE